MPKAKPRKKKKKGNTPNPQQEKQSYNQSTKKYMRQLQSFIENYGDATPFLKLDRYTVKTFECFQYVCPNFQEDPKHPLQKGFFKAIKKELVKVLHFHKFTPEGDKHSYSLYEGLTYIFGFLAVQGMVKRKYDECNQKERNFANAYPQIWDFFEGNRLIFRELEKAMDFYTNIFSFPCVRTYVFNWEESYTVDFKTNSRFIIKIAEHTSHKEKVKIKGITRPVFRLEFGIGGGLRSVEVDANEYKSGLNMQGLKLNVYFQSHAIERMYSRLDGLFFPYMGVSAGTSFIKPKFVEDPNYPNMVEFNAYNYKLGYFKYEIIDGKVIIKTFLLLSCTGTPEGDAFYANMCTSRKDLEHLNLDILSTYNKEEVDKYPELELKLREAGCGNLIDIPKFGDSGCPTDLALVDKFEQKSKAYLDEINMEQEEEEANKELSLEI